MPFLGPLGPLAGRLSIYLVIALGSFVAGLWVMSRWDDAAAARVQIAQDRANFEQIARNTARDKEATKALTVRLTASRERTQATIIEVPKYVPVEVNRACVINDGFGELHDAAAADRLPRDTGELSRSTRKLDLATVATTVAANYGTCHQWRHRLIEMIAWARKAEREKNANP